jgi:hypothetical protein
MEMIRHKWIGNIITFGGKEAMHFGGSSSMDHRFESNLSIEREDV